MVNFEHEPFAGPTAKKKRTIDPQIFAALKGTALRHCTNLQRLGVHWAEVERRIAAIRKNQSEKAGVSNLIKMKGTQKTRGSQLFLHLFGIESLEDLESSWNCGLIKNLSLSVMLRNEDRAGPYMCQIPTESPLVDEERVVMINGKKVAQRIGMDGK